MLTSEQLEIRDAVRQFAQEEVAPGAAERDRTKEFPMDVYRRAAELDYLGIAVAPEHGGAGLGLVEATIVGEEIAAACMSTASLVLTTYMVVDAIKRTGDEDLQARWLPGLCDGSVIGCTAITEPEAGSDALGLRTRATRTDGGWLLRGSKTFITGAPIADIALVYAKTGPVESREMGCFLVKTDQPGVTRSEPFDKMGWRASPTGELVLDDAFVPDEDVLAGPGEGLRALMSGLNSERVYLAAQSLGLCEAAYRAARRYATERRQFGRPIGDFQLVRAKLADMYAGIAACRALLYSTAEQVASGPSEGEPRLLSSAVKVLTSELAMRVTSEAVQVFGGYGYMAEYPVERYLRDAKILEIGGGTNEILRNLIGKALTAH